jgi:hypothetical protein
MTTHMQPSAALRGIAAAALGVLLLGACSGGVTTTPPAPQASSDTGAPSTGPGAPGGSAGGGIDALYCAAIKVADAQTLAKPTLSAAQTGGPESCTFVLPGQDLNGDNITVTVLEGDTDMQYYNDSVGGPVSGTPNPLPGVGDIAVWEQLTGESAPEVIAHQGSLTCVAQPPADTSQLTIDQTGSGPMYQISASAAAAYAVKLAVLCTDVFSVGG